MAQVKIKDLRENSIEEALRRVVDLKREAADLRLQHSTGQLENTSRLKLVRREIARSLTVVSEKRK